MGILHPVQKLARHKNLILLKLIIKMAYTITHFAFLAVLIFGSYSAPAEPSEDSVSQCYSGTYTTKENSTRSEILSKLKLIPCNKGACFGQKMQENHTLGCNTKRPDIEDGKCKEITEKNNVTIKECHCHDDPECILPLMDVPEENSEEKPEDKPKDKPEDKPKEKPEEKPEDKPACNNEEHGRHYDGLSFFGGIMLTVSVSLIGFFVHRRCHPRGIESQRLWN